MSQELGEDHELIGVIVPKDSNERLDKAPLTIVVPAERQQIKIISGQVDDTSKDQLTSNSLRNLDSVGRTQAAIEDLVDHGEPLKPNETTTKIIKLQNNLGSLGNKVGSTEVS